MAYALQETLGKFPGTSESAGELSIAWFMCPADQILQKPFNPFITCFMRYFEQSSENSEEENKKKFEEKYQELIEALSPHPGPLPKGEGVLPSPSRRGVGGEVKI